MTEARDEPAEPAERSRVRWHYTPGQVRVLAMLSREWRDYAVERGPFLLAREALDAEIRRGRYLLGEKSTSQLLFDVAEKQLASDQVRKARVELFGTVSEHSTPESEKFLEKHKKALAALPAPLQEDIHADGTATEVGKRRLGPYAYAGLAARGGTRTMLERSLLVELLKKYARDAEDCDRALRSLGEVSALPSSATEETWQRDSLEFGDRPGRVAAENGRDSLGFDTAREEKATDLRSEERTRDRTVDPTPEQARALGGAPVKTCLPEPGPPAGPVIASPVGDIVGKVKALTGEQRVHLFEELRDQIPVAIFARGLQDERVRPAIVRNLSQSARLEVFRLAWADLAGSQVAEFFGAPERRDLVEALRRTDRIQLAYKLWAALEPAQRDVFLADPDVRAALPERFQEALRIQYAFGKAGFSVTGENVTES